MSVLALSMPRRGRGRQCAADAERYERELRRWCDGIIEINSALDFKVSSRGWCYVLEEHKLEKGNFDVAERLINACRKSGLLPLDICGEDDGRAADHLERITSVTPAEFAAFRVSYLRDHGHEHFAPISFWNDLDVYVEMVVEKIDLKNLFSPVCEELHVPLTNISGWSDINSRAAMMRRFARWEAKGKQGILLNCVDHDPGGLHISEFLRSNLQDLADAVGWSPDNLIIDRFGLNYDFIQRHRLTWIDNLITGSGGDLADDGHNDHEKPYVQSYLRKFKARKVEANALVVRPDAGRKLCRDAILKYVPADAVERYERRLAGEQRKAQRAIKRLLNGGES